VLRNVYDAQLRAHVPERMPDGVRTERSGPITRTAGLGHRGFVEYRDLGDLTRDELDTLIAEQVAWFAALGEPFEWKLHGHDRPAFLAERLRAAGFVAEELETVMVAEIASLDLHVEPPDGVVLREVATRAEFERIAAMETRVWGLDESWHADSLEQEKTADPDGLRIFVAEAGGTVVSAGWLRLPSGTEFGTLWGGSTLAAWRGRGIYRALVARRGRLAVEQGRRYLEVDASDDSRRILERLGFVPVATTQPFVWSLGVANDASEE